MSPLARVLTALLLAAGLALAAHPPVSAQDQAEKQASNKGPRLEWVELSIGGLPLKVRGGGVATLHPDAPFRVLGAKSDAWLDLGLTWRLQGFPELDLNHYHTVAKLLGPRMYDTPTLKLEVLKNDEPIGAVSLLVRLLPIDWLRRAAAAESLDDKISHTERALELTPDDSLLIERLADLYTEAARYPQAAELLASHAQSAKDPRWLERLAMLYERMGDKERAAVALSKLAATRPGDTALLERLAGLYEDLARWEEAAALLERLAEAQSGPDRAASLARLSIARQKAGQDQLALQSMEKAVRLDGGQADYWQELARLRGAAGNRQGEREALQRASILSPKDRELHLALSQAFLAAEDKRGAIKELEKVAELSPEDPAPLLALAKLYQDMGWRKALARTYERLSKLQPTDPDLAFNLAVLAFEESKHQRCLELLEPVESARPDDPEVMELKLRALLGLKRWDEVMGLAALLLDKNPHDLNLWLAVLDRMDQKAPQEAGELLALVLAKNPKSAKLWQFKAALALEAEDPAGAIEALDKAVELTPKDLKLKFQLAGLLESQGRDARALELYEAILDADPAFPQAEERYLSLRTRQLGQKNSGKP
ncbi:MAG: tetratricopeptide repeat protein [Desulfarculaceae bacterium]|nr:tetratricopeptide repeat protein [Desulfarculaceae bacterium]MCF8073373.1 tetratricopeptide repeat protein [Desulfarculaceae bacterium]MCF8103517.1 tetratricopeptide repeat protein [Desulfarculaceae bacterium]MCF8115784.1 tetratricopeptide repeat protein [Desulfarculaceae bacterium]